MRERGAPRKAPLPLCRFARPRLYRLSAYAVLYAQKPQVVEYHGRVCRHLRADGRPLVERVVRACGAVRLYYGAERLAALDVDCAVCVLAEYERRVDVAALLRRVVNGSRVLRINYVVGVQRCRRGKGDRICRCVEGAARSKRIFSASDFNLVASNLL